MVGDDGQAVGREKGWEPMIGALIVIAAVLGFIATELRVTNNILRAINEKIEEEI